MPLSTIGDMRQHFISSRANTSLRSELNTLVEELTSGQSSDLTSHLGAGQTKLSGLDRQLDMLESYARSNVETGQLLSTMQTAIGNVENHRGLTSSALLTIGDSSSVTQIKDAGTIARVGLDASVQSLNMRFGDSAMFGGLDLDSSPLADADTILSEIRTAISGLTSETDIAAAIDDWFDLPGGGFEALAYQGDETGFLSRTTEANHAIDIDVRADDQAFRDVFKALTKAAIAGDMSLTLNSDVRQNLQKQAGVDLLSAASPLADLQGRIGFSESRVEEAVARISAQQTSYSIARNDMVSADPFETATRLEAVQLQLETQYTLTARLSRLSLTEYLR